MVDGLEEIADVAREAFQSALLGGRIQGLIMELELGSRSGESQVRFCLAHRAYHPKPL